MEMLSAIQFSLVLLFANMTGCVGETDNAVLNSDIVEQLLTQVNENTDLIKNLVEENNLLKVRMTAIETHARQDSFILRKKIQKQTRLVNNLLQLVARNSASSVIQNIETKPISHNDTITQLNSPVEHNTINNNTHKQAEDNQQAANESVIKKTTNGQRIRRQIAVVGENVAFTAGINRSPYTGSGGQPVIFERIITNNGDAYDATTGEFRAPVAGTYVFSTTLMTYSNERSNYYIYKNEATVSKMKIVGDISLYSSTSNTVVLELAPGDKVTVRDKFSDQELYGFMYSIFSGFLLHQPFPEVSIS